MSYDIEIGTAEFGLGRLRMSFDLRLFDVDRGVELFATAAQELGAYFAAARSTPPYRELVAEHLLGVGKARELAGGVFVRMTDEPRPPAELGDRPLPSELTYRYRPPSLPNTRRWGQIEPA